MQVIVTENAPILIPNKEHNNFTTSNSYIKEGTILEGNSIEVKGKRRGEDFTYKLFATDNKQLIHLKKTQPMNVREVTLGANGSRKQEVPRETPSPTVVSVPTKGTMFTNTTIAGSIIGVIAGYVYSKNKNFNTNKRNMYTVLGGVVGFAVSRYMERSKLLVKPSK
jgi:hypothetical protein